MKIKAIFWDFGRVLTTVEKHAKEKVYHRMIKNPENEKNYPNYPKYFDNEKEADIFIHEICNRHWHKNQDGGRPISEGIKIAKNKIDNLIAKKIISSNRKKDFYKSIENYYNDIDLQYQGASKGNIEIIRQMKKQGYQIFGLTNWTHERPPESFKNSGAKEYLPLMDDVLMSSIESRKLGKTILKPNKEIYKLALKRFGYLNKPKQTIFIDDKLENVKSAEKAGINGIKYNNNPLEIALILYNNFNINLDIEKIVLAEKNNPNINDMIEILYKKYPALNQDHKQTKPIDKKTAIELEKE
jgi:FMN phosphatase YigB (HAD superfamily)